MLFFPPCRRKTRTEERMTWGRRRRARKRRMLWLIRVLCSGRISKTGQRSVSTCEPWASHSLVWFYKCNNVELSRLSCSWKRTARPVTLKTPHRTLSLGVLITSCSTWALQGDCHPSACLSTFAFCPVLISKTVSQ